MKQIKLVENERERQEAVREIERLWGAEPGTPDADRLRLLMMLVELYERNKFALAPTDPITAILFRLEQSGLTRKNLEPLLGGRNRVSEVLSGTRELSKAMIVKLHSHLGIPLESLFGPGAPVTLLAMGESAATTRTPIRRPALKRTPRRAAAMLRRKKK